jgi:hypothetical protein
MMFASPAGKITISPACSRTAGSGASTASAQQVPSVTTWKPITRSAAPITCSPIRSAPGLSVAKGDRASTSKKTAPVRRTASRTSDSTSTAHLPDGR